MRFKKNEKHRIKANVELTPLIDVVFQLLIFFMLSSTFVVQSSLPIEVPETEGSTKLEQKDVTITLSNEEGGPDGEGRVVIQRDEEVEINDWLELEETLRALKQADPEVLVLVRADQRVPTGRTVKAFGYIVAAGIERYGIAARPPGEEEE